MKTNKPATGFFDLRATSGERPFDSTQGRRATGLIDTHAHLTFPEFEKDLGDVLARAWDAGLEYIILVGAGDGIAGNERAIELAEKNSRLFAMIGVHPHDAGKMKDSWMVRLEDLAREKKVVAIGEIGLDYHYENSPRDIQRVRFKEMISLGGRFGKPLVIHDREAHEDVWKIVRETKTTGLAILLHCFSGNDLLAKKVINAGFKISIPGIVTFSNAKVLRQVVAAMPLESMVIETDCPFLAPVPFRGKRNEPAFVVEVAREIARIKGLTLADVARVTTLNAKRFFMLPGSELVTSIAYTIRNSLYLNITNRCNLACRFCPKLTDFEVKGYNLRLLKEPSVEEVFQSVGQPQSYDEVVFCGYGEPTLRIEILKVIAGRMKEKGAKKVRLNTDGLANLTLGRDVLPELKGIIDSVSVSLNAADEETYIKNCPSKFGKKAYGAACEFIREARRYIPEVVATVVALPGLDIEACRKKADELGVKLRVREYMNVG